MSHAPATIVVAVLCVVSGCGRSSSTPAPPPPASTTTSANTAKPATAVITPLRLRASDGAAWTPAATFDHGIDYLARDYSPSSLFDDPYITNCADPKHGCKTEYRELDHSILVLYWIPSRIAQDPRLASVAKYATKTVARWLEHWRNLPLERDAIDLYALFPYYFPGRGTKPMVAELVKAVGPTGDWKSYDAHGPA